MDISNVIKFYDDCGKAELEFDDKSKLIVIPHAPNWGGNVEGLRSVLLYQDRKLEALVDLFGGPEDIGGFWSRGAITQQQLAEYCKIAKDVGNDIYKKYTKNEINKQTWLKKYYGFWRVVDEIGLNLEGLKNGTKRVLETRPVRWRDQI